MTVDELIDRLTALRRKNPAAGGVPITVEHWHAVMTPGPPLLTEYAEVVRAYFGGKDCQIVVIKGP
jgi:hypothetical protein